jgi:hypothetical protein
MAKVRVWKLENRASPGEFLAVDSSGFDAISDGIMHAEAGESFTVTIEEWDKADLDNLPEWDGW